MRTLVLANESSPFRGVRYLLVGKQQSFSTWPLATTLNVASGTSGSGPCTV